MVSEMLSIFLWTFWIVLVRCAVSQGGKVCRDAVIPASKPRGVNQVGNNSSEPLFELELIPRDQAGGFEVRIATAIQAYAFTEVTVALATDSICGKGNLHYDSQDFTQTQQDDSCPNVLSTKQKTPLSSLPSLVWTPPSCGCVQFRVVLVLAAENFYYTETEGVSMGPLAKRICVPERSKELTRKQRLEALCHVSEKHTSRSILSSMTFRQRHQLDSQYTDRLELEMALELRRSDARMCCSKVSQAEKLKCFENARYRRADRFCQDGFPDIPFVSFRSIFMRSKERRCCSILGTYRYLCFAKDSQLKAGSDVTPMDFSLDATDLINDLADFATLEDYQEVLDKTLNISTTRHEVLDDKNNPQDDNLKGKDIKVEQNQSESSKNGGLRTALYSSKNIKSEAINPKVTDVKSSIRNKQLSQDNLKSPEPIPSPSSVQHTQAKMEGGISGSGMAPKSSEIYRRLPTYSKPRGKIQTSEERRKYRRRLGGRSGIMRQPFRRSGERKDRERKSNTGRRVYTKPHPRSTRTSKEVGRDSRRLTSSERRYRGFRRSGKSTEVFDRSMNVMEDIDNEGGVSVEDTLNYLQRKMQRLELRRLCCEYGAVSGSGVYGSLSVVMTECKHSSQKYLQREEIAFGVRMCRRQFVRCCMDEAKMGLTMSSTEFHNQAFDGYLDNVGMAESANQDDVFLRRRLLRKRQKTMPKRFKTPRQDATLQEILEAESDKRFESMRAAVDDPRFVVEQREGEEEEDDEITGPRRFDEEDNRCCESDFAVTNKWIPVDKTTPAISQIKEPKIDRSFDAETNTKAEVEQEEDKDKDDDDGNDRDNDDGDDERDENEEDFDDVKKIKTENKRKEAIKAKDDGMIQSQNNTHRDGIFSESDNRPQSNVTERQMTLQSRSWTERQARIQFQNKSTESSRSIATQNFLNNTQNRGSTNESVGSLSSQPMRQEVLHQRNQATREYSEASSLSKIENYLGNVNKSNTSSTKDKADVLKMAHRKAGLPPAQSQNKTSLDSRLSSVHDNLPKTVKRNRLHLNEDPDASLIRQQEAIASRKHYGRRSRERSRASSSTADNFMDTFSKRSRSRMSRRREGGSSRWRFRNNERRRQRGYLPEYEEKGVKGHKTKNRQVAMDSQEMADAHDEKVKLTALDSKEMAARYNQRNDSTATFRHKDTFTGRAGRSSKRGKRHRKRIGQGYRRTSK